jgi:hypothetical protein
MKSVIAFFPSGFTGAGLLCLRLSVAGSVLLMASPLPGFSYLPQFVGVLIAVSLCAGLQTRLLAGLSLLASLSGLAAAAVPAESVMVHGLSAIALALTGPGAFSADARLFGRKTIRLPEKSDPKV